MYASVRRRDGVSHEHFTTYWRDVHSTLCSRLPGLGFYVQQHFEREGGDRQHLDREEDSRQNGSDRLHCVHVYMSRRPGNDAAQWLRDTSADLASLDVIRKWKLRLPEPYDNAHPAPPSPDVDHAVGPDRHHLAVAEVAFENARVARDFFAGTAFKKVFSAQAKYIDAIGAYRVSGFYTFVRDGIATSAGIRGSRAAELIDDLGAANQLVPSVRQRFVKA